MPTIQQQLNQLKKDKESLNTMLNTMGVETTGNETFTELTPLVGKIVTDPILQDKSIEITENGTTNIVADSGYDGLNNVEVITNVVSSGGETPEKGVVFSEYDENGYPTKVTLIGYEPEIPTSILENPTTIDAFTSLENIQEIIVTGEPTHIGASAFAGNTKLKYITLPDTIESMGGNVFRNNYELELDHLPASLKDNFNQTSYFQNCYKLRIKTIPDGVTSLSANSMFLNCRSIIQLSMRNVTAIGGNTNSTGTFGNCTGLKAVWIGSAIKSNTFVRYAFAGCTSLNKMFIDLPRATVETFKYYQYAFMNDTSKTGIIVCNDDEGFMTKEEFDAIDWSTQ